MPLVNVKAIEGVFSEAQKREIVEKMTEVIVGIEGEHMGHGEYVLILAHLHEPESTDVGFVGG